MPRVLFAYLFAVCLFGQTDVFEAQVRPVLVANCAGCHGPKTRMAGIDLTDVNGIRGAQPRLLDVVRYQGKVKMPPTGRLKDSELKALEQWMASGGALPAATAKTEARAKKTLWSTVPPKRVAPPAVKDTTWAKHEIDRFLLARIEEKGLKPAPAADKRTLLRRATFDLTGLPPTEAEMQAFLNDPSATAFETVVDRLLASPRYAEKYARHWLDVARYADSTGTDEDHRYPHAWRYRDYVIDALKRDLPYDQFLREQIAGDLMPPEGNEKINTRGIVATGFLALGPKLLAEEDKVKIIYDIVDEQIEVMSRGMLGLTISCARCHDHKTDPIATKDYYSLASIFASTKQVGDMSERVIKLYTSPLVPATEAAAWEAHQQKLTGKQQEITKTRDKVSSARVAALRVRLADYMVAAHQVYAGGKALEATAQATGLDAIALEQMVNYLKPNGERKPHLEAWHKASPENVAQVARQYQTQFESAQQQRAAALEAWKKTAEEAKKAGQPAPEMPRYQAGDDRFLSEVNSSTSGPFALPKDEQKAAPFIPAATQTQLAQLKTELDELKHSGPKEPPMACAVAEGEPVKQQVFIRGNHEAKGDPVEKRFPTVLAGAQQPPITQGSGRLQLAQWLGSDRNPLAARVIVNRAWYWHFGEGIVRTPSNFGFTGEAPTHPELLDWLATEFVANGWSLKKLHRMMMLTSAYQMSSQASEQQLKTDPENRLLSRFGRRRLQAEEIRDALLELDGTLDLTMGGTLQSGEGTDDFSTKRLGVSPEDSPRRTVYLPLRRSNVPTALMLFDFGDATTTMEGRAQTNIAPQALYMMNSPFVGRRAENIATRLVKANKSDAERVKEAWLLVLNRPAGAGDVDDALTFLKGYPGGSSAAQAWKSYVRALFGSNDFLYIQ